MRALEHLVGSRPARIGIILLWLILGGLGGSFAQCFQNVHRNEESSFLPGSSESVRELTLAREDAARDAILRAYAAYRTASGGYRLEVEWRYVKATANRAC